MYTSNKGRVVARGHAANVQVQASYLLFDNEALILLLRILCSVKAGSIHAVNALLWHPGKQTHKLQTNKPNDQ